MTPSFSIFGDIDVIAANYGPNKSVSNVSFYDSAGVVTNSSVSTYTYQSTAPARSSNPTATFVDNRTAGTGTTVSTFDDGVYKNTTTRTYVSSTQTKIDSVSTFVVYKLGTLDIQPLALKVGGTFRF